MAGWIVPLDPGRSERSASFRLDPGLSRVPRLIKLRRDLPVVAHLHGGRRVSESYQLPCLRQECLSSGFTGVVYIYIYIYNFMYNNIHIL